MAEFTFSPVARWRRIVDLIFPPRCGGCGAPGSLWCAACQASAQPIAPPFCARCGKPGTPSHLCASCRASAPAIDSIRALTMFDGRMRHAIHAFKYQGLATLADPLGDALASFWLAAPAPARAIAPVPLHPQRQRERGYNQAELLARRVGRKADLPIYAGALRRVRATAVQMTLGAEERRANVAGAFRCSTDVLRGAAVLLIDDVCTTGATLDACALALKEGGVTAVYGLVLARAA
ncbi:MAG TPA: ComF family protein [Anaerolineae bacterium]|nr:ComF family protein [Anaerolineae bacterium]